METSFYEHSYRRHTEFATNLDSLLDRLGNVIESKQFIENLIRTLYLCKDGLPKQLYKELISDILEIYEDLNDKKVYKIKLLTTVCISLSFPEHFTSLLLDDIDDIVSIIKKNTLPKSNFGRPVQYRLPRYGDYINLPYIQVMLPRVTPPTDMTPYQNNWAAGSA